MKNNNLTLKLALQLAAPHTWIASIGPVRKISFKFLEEYFTDFSLYSDAILCQYS